MEKKKFDPKTLNDFERSLYRDYSEDVDAHDDAITDFDAFEAMGMSKTYDSVSRETGNGLTDSKTSTIYLERAARVAGQLPEGVVKAFGKRDYGKGLFMDILRTKWIYPNANAQRPFLTKMFLWQYGSSQYGYMPMYYDLNVTPSGYFGPDCWLWNPRNFIPQNGFTTVSEMDYCHALAYKSPSWFEDLLEEDDNSGWRKNEIREAMNAIKEATKEVDEKRDTLKVRTQQKQSTRQICVATRYEAGKDGRWISFLPDFGYKVIRVIKNPHKNSRIPFVIKPCIPTFDSFYNIGDFQRSMPMQFANDGLDNFYFQGIKINLFPPTVVNAQGVVRHTIRQEAAAIWETTGPVPGNVQRLETSTAGLATYQNAKGMAQGAIQSIAGTTDTRSNSESASDPGFGKTPEALKMIAERESTRDNQDRAMLEEAMKELLDGMFSIIPTISEKIPVDLFAEEIEEIIKAGYVDLAEIFKINRDDGTLKWRMAQSGNQMRLRIDPSKLKGLEYRFELEPNSTAKKTKESQLSSMLDFLNFVGKMPNALQQYQESTGRVPNWDHIFKQFGMLADIPGMEAMFMQAPTPTQPQQPVQQPNDVVPPEAAGVVPENQPVQPQMPQAPVEQMMPAQPAMPPTPQGDPLMVGGMKFNDPRLADEARKLLLLVRK